MSGLKALAEAPPPPLNTKSFLGALVSQDLNSKLVYGICFSSLTWEVSAGRVDGRAVGELGMPARGPALPARKSLLSSSFGWSEREGKENTLAYLCQQRVWQAAASCRSCALRAAPGEHPRCRGARLLLVTLHSGLTR